jgi:hypothetical protein
MLHRSGQNSNGSNQRQFSPGDSPTHYSYDVPVIRSSRGARGRKGLLMHYGTV